MAQKTKAEFKPGAQFGQWKLVQGLDEGGNGVVWLVERADGTLGALKTLKNPTNAKQNQRFQDEVKAMHACEDVRGVLPVLEHNLPARPTKSNPAWFVMPRATPLEKSPPSGLQEAVDVCIALANTLTSLHQRNMSHRDIKPGNVLKFNGEWHLGDFGLIDFPGKIDLTRQGEKLGPQHYIAPEMLVDASAADGRAADVYSLAKLLWKLATGQKFPMPGMIVRSIRPLTLSGNIAAPNTASLDTLLEAMTHIEPGKRPSMTDVVNELIAWRSPAPPATGSADLRPFAKRVDAINANFKADQERSAALEADANRLIELLVESLQPVVQLIGAAVDSAKIGTWTGERTEKSAYFFEHKLEELELYDRICVSVISRVDGKHFRGRLRSGINVGMKNAGGYKKYDLDAPAIIAAGHEFEIESPRGSYQWERVTHKRTWASGDLNFQVGMPSQTVVVTRLTADVIAELQSAFDAMISALEEAARSTR